MRKYGFIISLLLYAFTSLAEIKYNDSDEKKINIYLAGASSSRIDFGAQRMSEMLRQKGFEVTILPKRAKMPPTRKVQTIFIGLATDGLMQMLVKELHETPVKSAGKEGF